jgi:hypothetical protein
MKCTVVVDKFYQNNRFFDENDLLVNRDDCMRQYIELRLKLLESGIELNTNDITPVETSGLVIFINVPDKEDVQFKKAVILGKTCYLLVNELYLIHKLNSDLEMHKYFTKIFTYQQELIDNIKYFKTNYSFDFNQKYQNFKAKSFHKKKMAALIAGNKTLDHPLELYSERVNFIRWFEANHPAEFDLYGIGWNTYKGKLHALFGKKEFPSYRGKMKLKNEMLSNYKFNICYENAHSIPGWITEKIFDSFFAACVPVYWGWEEAVAFIDRNCYIKRTDYKSHEELYLYLSSMTEAEYGKYISNIESFLLKSKNDENNEFGIPYYVKTIADQILIDIK